MIDFAVKGTVAGINTSMDGTKSFVKIQPSASAAGLNRDERPGLADILVPAHLLKNLAMNALVVVKGKILVYLREARDKEGKTRLFTNYRFEGDAIEAVKA